MLRVPKKPVPNLTIWTLVINYADLKFMACCAPCFSALGHLQLEDTHITVV